nr:putative ORF1 [Marmot picobirnavirus]
MWLHFWIPNEYKCRKEDTAMTANQLAYLNLQETKRNNIVTSSEQKRHNLVGEVEAHRGNTLTYKASKQRVKEEKRHNKASEKEQKRSNKRNEALTKRGQNVSKANTQTSAAAQVNAAQTAAAATRYAAYTSAEAQKYAARRNANASRFATMVNAQNVDRQTQTQKDIADINREINEYSKGMDLLISQVKSGSERAKLQQAKKEYELAVKRYKLDRNTKTWDLVLKTGRQFEKLAGNIGAGIVAHVAG